jgi:poly-gamma-glutamate capsule biosynthesis protein CapA/YwtB (metallophosphatase superfamily)
MAARLVFLGDFCAIDGVMPTLGTSLSELVSNADLVSMNLEGAITESGFSQLPKVGPGIGQPESVLRALKTWGVSLFVTANNHIMDFGQEGLQYTMMAAGEVPTLGAGMSFEAAYQPHYSSINGIRIAILAFSEGQFGVLLEKSASVQAGYAWIDHPAARASILEARSKADYVIVQAHAGLEMVSLPLPEWRERYREFIDLGADLVVGHHPHVIQGSECYKGKTIFYSIGNFYMDFLVRRPQPGNGGVVVVDIDRNQIRSQLLPLHIEHGKVSLDTDEAAMRAYQALCEQLKNDKFYMAEIDRICEDSWQQIYSKYYEIALLGLWPHPSLKKILRMVKLILKKLISLPRQSTNTNELMLIHNIRIESHRWVVDRALRNRCVSKRGEKP